MCDIKNILLLNVQNCDPSVYQYPGEPLGGVCNDLMCNHPAAAFKVSIKM